MSRPVLLDLFCGAGGAAMGYHRAGFDIVGVDVVEQPRYPFLFIRGDAISVAQREGRHFDAIHASPPCQARTTMNNRHRGRGSRASDRYVSLIAATRSVLGEVGAPYVIENVVGARAHMCNPILLHGGVFDLGVYRPRLFESNIALHSPAPAGRPIDPVGVYGARPDGRRLFTRKDGTVQRAARSLGEARRAMGIDWMSWEEIAQAIPPAYTERVGFWLLRALGSAEAVA